MKKEDISSDKIVKPFVNIVIPMAGAGSRFKVAGYDVPKPFIKFKEKMMIEHVLSSFNAIDARFILILQERFLTEQKEQLNYLKSKYPVSFVTVPKLTMGAAITSLAAHKTIDKTGDIIFADSDNIFKSSDILNFLQYVREKDFSGALLTTKSDKPCYSYAKIDKDGYLVETKEKEVISNHAITGVYYFKNLEEFKDAVIDLVVESDITKGEFYMSNVFNHLKKITSKIGIFDVGHFDCVGTPEQLDKYIKEHSNEKV